jgi:hypothetical protein
MKSISDDANDDNDDFDFPIPEGLKIPKKLYEKLVEQSRRENTTVEDILKKMPREDFIVAVILNAE